MPPVYSPSPRSSIQTRDGPVPAIATFSGMAMICQPGLDTTYIYGEAI